MCFDIKGIEAVNKNKFVFPVNALPEFLYEKMLSISSGYNIRIEVCVFYFVTIIGSLIGANRKVIVSSNHSVFHNTYLCLLGNSGGGKSPIMRFLLKHVKDLDIDLAKKRSFALLADDFTIEGLRKSLQTSLHGLLVAKEELGTLMSEAYRNNSNKSNVVKDRLIQLFDGDAWKKDRVSDDYEVIEHALISLMGAVTYDRFTHLFDDEDVSSGLFQRFVFINLIPQLRYYPENDIDESVDIFLKSLYRFTVESRPDEIIYKHLTCDAKTIYINWFNSVAEELLVEESKNNPFSGFISKYRDLPLKFASILHHLDSFNGQEYLDIQAHHIESGIILAEYARTHTEHTWQMLKPSKKKFQVEEQLLIYLQSFFSKTIDETVLISSSQITSDFNKLITEKFGRNNQCSGNKIGRLMSALGVRRYHDKDGNYYMLEREQFV